ncbi:ECF-type sigma factor (plasmid) [Nocardia sp. NBC_01377]|uniref:ECF-type sigma factor n=1 Tax=Nocardia sp. NBC_01377 TaxID=2903595 RepID=UPI00324C506B
MAHTVEIVLRQWNVIRTPKAFLYMVATRTLGAHRTELARALRTFETDDELSDVGFFWWRTHDQAPESAALDEEFTAIAVGAMTTSEKAVFLRRIAGYSNAEVAAALAITARAAQRAYDRAREKARRSLSDRGLHDDRT